MFDFKKFSWRIFRANTETKNEKESENYEIIKVLKGHELPVRTLCYISENYFASGSFDDKIKIWDLKNYKEVQTLKGHTSNVICVIKYNEDMQKKD